MIKSCQKAEIDEALSRIHSLWDQGYAAVDIVTTIFRVVKTMDELPEYTRLEFIRVSNEESFADRQEIGWTHMRILEGVGTIVQLGAMIARLCRMSLPPDALKL
jgi:replication factor C subunit 2/4